MVTRLSTSDAAFYHQEDTATPMYVGSLAILRRPRGGLSYEALLATVEQRLPQIPRYRQKVRQVSLGLARPVWVDDPDFDITYHVRRSALPSPGSDAQLHDLVSRLAGRPLDRGRPLWEMYLIEGLAGNRLALFIKSHQALVNGLTAVEIGHVIADRNRRPAAAVEDIARMKRAPSGGRARAKSVARRMIFAASGSVRLGPPELSLTTNRRDLLLNLSTYWWPRPRSHTRASSSPVSVPTSREKRGTRCAGVSVLSLREARLQRWAACAATWSSCGSRACSRRT